MAVQEFLKTVTNTIIDDCAAFIQTAAAPARIASNEIQATLTRFEYLSIMRLETSQSRMEILRKFSNYKRHFVSSPDRDGKYVYYFLSSVESLPYPQNEEWIFKATAFIDAEPDLAIAQIGRTMHELTQNGTLNLMGQAKAALGN